MFWSEANVYHVIIHMFESDDNLLRGSQLRLALEIGDGGATETLIKIQPGHPNLVRNFIFISIQ
jgi:hypothetical protein